MTYQELFDKVGDQLEVTEQFLFSMVLEKAAEMTQKQLRFPVGWQEFEIRKDGAQALYQNICIALQFKACELATDFNDQVFDQGTQIASVMRQVIVETLAVELEAVEILSPCKVMIRRGLLEPTVDPGGKATVVLTEKGRSIAESMRKSGGLAAKLWDQLSIQN